MGAFTPRPGSQPAASFNNSPNAPAPLPPGAAAMQARIDAGTPVSVAQQMRQTEADTQIRAGRPPADVDAEFGLTGPKPGGTAFTSQIAANLKNVWENQPDVVSDPMHLAEAGFQSSVTGLSIRGKLPSMVPSSYLGVMGKILYASGQAVGDIPAYIAGYAMGGQVGGVAGEVAAPEGGGLIAGPVFAYGMSNMLPTLMRESLTKSYAAGEHETWLGAAQSAGETLVDSAKAFATGAIAGPLGGAVAGKVGALGATAAVRGAASVADTMSQAAAATVVAAQLDGRVPNGSDFGTGAALALGFHVAAKVVGTAQRTVLSDQGNDLAANLRATYAATGADPRVVGQRAAIDPVVMGEVAGPFAADGTRIQPEIDAHAPAEPPLHPSIIPPAEGAEPTDEEKAKAQDEEVKANDAHADRELKIQGDDGEWMPPHQAVVSDTSVEGEVIPPSKEVSTDTNGSTAAQSAPEAKPPTQEENILTILKSVDKTVAGGKPPIWTDLRKLLATFSGQLAPGRAYDRQIGSDRSQMTIEDWARTMYASAQRAGLTFMHGVIDPETRTFVRNSPSERKGYALAKERGGTADGLMAYRLALRTLEKSGQQFDDDGKLTRVPLGTGIELGPDFNAAWQLALDPDMVHKYHEATQMITAAKNARIDYVVKSGALTPEQGDAWKRFNEYHIVARRVFDPKYTPGQPPRAGWGATKVPKALEGSQRQIVDPNTTEVDNAHWQIAMADRTRAILNIIDQVNKAHAKDTGTGLIGHNGGPPLDPDFNLGAVREIPWDGGTPKLEDELGQPVDEAAAKAAIPLVQLKNFAKMSEPNEVAFVHEGKLKVWTAPSEEFAQMLRMPWHTPDHPVVGIAAALARIARSGITGNFDFSLRAMTHGMFAAGVNAPHGSLIPFHDLMGGLFHVIRKTDEYKDFVASGGAGAALADIDLKYIKNDTLKMLQSTGTLAAVRNAFKDPTEITRVLQHQFHAATENPWTTAGKALISPITVPAKAMQGMGHFLHLSAQVGYARRAAKKGLSLEKAAMESRTAYLDYREQFALPFIQTLSRITPFWSTEVKDFSQSFMSSGASLGKYKPSADLARAMGKWVGAGMTMLTSATIMNYLWNHDADKKLPAGQKWSDLPRWYRDTHMVLPPINGARFALRIPYDIGFLFKILPERAMDYMLTKNPHAFDGLLASAYTETSQIPIPTILAPAAEEWSNKTNYSGTSIIPDSLMSATNGYMQYYPDTTPEAKALARALGTPGLGLGDISPITIDNYVKNWAGPLPMTVARALNNWVDPPKIKQPWSISDTPWVGSFFARNPGLEAQPIEDFYADLDTFTKAQGDIIRAAKNVDTSSRARGYVAPAEVSTDTWASPIGKDMVHLQLIAAVKTYALSLSYQRAAIMSISTSKLTPNEKLKWTDSLVSHMVKSAEQGSELIQALKSNAPEGKMTELLQSIGRPDVTGLQAWTALQRSQNGL